MKSGRSKSYTILAAVTPRPTVLPVLSTVELLTMTGAANEEEEEEEEEEEKTIMRKMNRTRSWVWTRRRAER
jgi:hypothetical protein